MATLAVGSSTSIPVSPGISLSLSSSFGTTFRYSFTPTNVDFAAVQSYSRSYGPAAQSVTIGPFSVHGTVSITNDAGSALTYATLVSSLTEFGGVTVYGALSMTAAANVTLSPTGAGTVTINPATAGAMDNVAIGSTTRRGGGFSTLALSSTDSSGTPGNVTNNSPKGRVAIAAGANNVVVTTNIGVSATSTVLAVINQATADATLTQIVRVVPAAGSFTIYGNANATANTVVDFVVLIA